MGLGDNDSPKVAPKTWDMSTPGGKEEGYMKRSFVLSYSSEVKRVKTEIVQSYEVYTAVKQEPRRKQSPNDSALH